MSNYMKTLNINNNAFYAFVSRWFFSCNHNLYNVIVTGALFFSLLNLLKGEIQKSESAQNKNKKNHNKFLRLLCDNYILLTHWTLVKQKNPASILIFVLSPVLAFQSFYLLKIYLVILISNAIFMDICYRVSFIGHPVCAFLKNHATPELFLLIGNSPFEALFTKLSGPAVKSIVKPVIIAAGVGLGSDYIASTCGLHQLGTHAAQDAYNGEWTKYKHDPNINRDPYLDRLIESAKKK